MTTSATISNVTAAEAAQRIASLAAAVPPPAKGKPRPNATLCAFARDTGEPAFAGLPCRGSRIECRKTGGISYAAACRSGDNCKYYTEAKNE